MKRTYLIVFGTVLGLIAHQQSFADQVNSRAELDALLGGTQVFEDFESFDISSESAVNLDVFDLDSTTIANGQGPGLVMPGATYRDPNQSQLQWNGDNYFGLVSKTFMANGGTGAVHIDYAGGDGTGAAVTAMGVDLLAFGGFGWSGLVEVFDTNNLLLSSTAVSNANGGSEITFFGWEHADGIGRVEISNTTWSWSPVIDNHGYGQAIPEPSSFLALSGLLGLVVLRRRKR